MAGAISLAALYANQSGLAKNGFAVPPQPVAVPNAADFASSLGSGPGLEPDAPPDPITFKGNALGYPVNSLGQQVIPGKQGSGIFSAPLPKDVAVIDPPSAAYADKSYIADPKTGQLKTADGKFAFQPAPGGGSWVATTIEDLGGDEPTPIGPPTAAQHAAKVAPGKETHVDPATGKVIEVATEMDGAAPGPAPSGGGPVAAGGPAPAPHPATLADKKNALLLPGQEESFQNEKEFHTSQQVWNDTIADKSLETEAAVNAMNAEALDAQASMLAKEREEREEFERYQATEHTRLQQESDKIANAKMDPNRLFKGEKGWISVTAAIAGAIFGVMGAPATGGKNMGVEAVNNAIDRDLALQAKDLENQKQGVARKATLLAQKREVFKDKAQAMAAARIDAWKLAMAKADSYAAQSGQEIHVLQAAKIREAGEREIAREQENFDLSVEAGWKQYQAQKEADRLKAAAAAQARIDKYADKILDVELAGAKKVLEEYPGAEVTLDKNHVVITDPTTGKRLWAGTEGGGPSAKLPTVTIPGEMNAAGQWSSAGTAVAHNPEAASKYNEITFAAKKGLELIERARKLRAKNNGGTILDSSEDEAEADSIERELYSAKKTAGENSDKDAERILKTIPGLLKTDPKAAVMGGKAKPDASLDALEASFKADIARANGTHLKKPPTNPVPLTATPKAGK